MTRPLRLHVPGMLYHVVARGDDKACIFRDDTDYAGFLELLAGALSRFGVRCASFCALWNHYHLLLAAGDQPISRMMQQLNSSYCQRFNRRHHRVGHVLQGRFGSRIVEDGAYARAVLRYIALNPVAAGLVADPRDWRWSSYRCTVGSEAAREFLAADLVWLAFGTSDPAIGRARFADFVLAGRHEVFGNPLFHGSARLAGHLAPRLEPHESTRDFVYAQRFATRASLGTLFEGILRRDDLQIAAHEAFYRHAYTLSEIGTTLGRDPSTIWRWVRRASARLRAARPESGGSPENASAGEDNRARIKI
jgi:putative transposase